MMTDNETTAMAIKSPKIDKTKVATNLRRCKIWIFTHFNEPNISYTDLEPLQDAIQPNIPISRYRNPDQIP
jgi:hypothetical protein